MGEEAREDWREMRSRPSSVWGGGGREEGRSRAGE